MVLNLRALIPTSSVSPRRIEPLTVAVAGRRPSAAMALTLLPEPDSPARPWIFPAVRSSEMPCTTGVGFFLPKEIVSSRIRSALASDALAWAPLVSDELGVLMAPPLRPETCAARWPPHAPRRTTDPGRHAGSRR